MKQKPIKHLGSVNTHSHTHIGICMCRLNNNNNCKKNNNNNTPSRASLVVRFISSCSWATALACLWFSPYMTVCQCVCVCASMCMCVCQKISIVENFCKLCIQSLWRPTWLTTKRFPARTNQTSWDMFIYSIG